MITLSVISPQKLIQKSVKSFQPRPKASLIKDSFIKTPRFAADADRPGDNGKKDLLQLPERKRRLGSQDDDAQSGRSHSPQGPQTPKSHHEGDTPSSLGLGDSEDAGFDSDAWKDSPPKEEKSEFQKQIEADEEAEREKARKEQEELDAMLAAEAAVDAAEKEKTENADWRLANRLQIEEWENSKKAQNPEASSSAPPEKGESSSAGAQGKFGDS